MRDEVMHLPQMLKEYEVSRLLGISMAALRRWRRENRGPRFSHLGRCVRYSARDVERYISMNASDGDESGNHLVDPNIRREGENQLRAGERL
jgi:predicted DNA-binding transcriptional regulator AlpA